MNVVKENEELIREGNYYIDDIGSFWRIASVEEGIVELWEFEFENDTDDYWHYVEPSPAMYTEIDEFKDMLSRKRMVFMAYLPEDEFYCHSTHLVD